MARSVAMALVEEQKVARWTKEMGIEKEADLAYWFDSQQRPLVKRALRLHCLASGPGPSLRPVLPVW